MKAEIPVLLGQAAAGLQELPRISRAVPKQERLFCEEGAGMGDRAQGLQDNGTLSSIRDTTSG